MEDEGFEIDGVGRQQERFGVLRKERYVQQWETRPSLPLARLIQVRSESSSLSRNIEHLKHDEQPGLAIKTRRELPIEDLRDCLREAQVERIRSFYGFRQLDKEHRVGI